MHNKENFQVFKVIAGNEGVYRVSEDIIVEFEEAVLKCRDVVSAGKNSYYYSRLLFRIWKRLLINKTVRDLFTAIYRLIFFKAQNYFVVLMGPRFPKCFPYVFKKGTKSIYIFDAWPSYIGYINRFVKDFNIDFVFISSKRSSEVLNQLVGRDNVFWVPEGVDAKKYKFCPFNEKDIDILSFGRKYELFHEKIVESLANQNINYKYPSDDKMVFPDQKSFIDGLARTKISVCFPRSITHTEWAGDIETMTNRYLQSMAAKCLVLGNAPDEMIQLFGYNPVVEVDMENPAEQITGILKNYEKYFDIIEKNYQMVVENHTWDKRWELISTIISEKNKKR